MNKIFIKEIFLSIFIVLSSFFLSSSKVKAQTYTYTLSPSVYDIFTDEGFYEFYHNNFSDVTNYVIQKSGTQFLFYINANISSYSCSYGGSTFVYCSSTPSGATTWKEFSFPPFIVKGSAYDAWKSKSIAYSSSDYIIASSIPLVSSDFNTYIFNIGDETYSCGTSTEHCIFPTLLDLYKMHHSDPTLPPSPPTPEDNTPLLTNFITISINKLTFICDFITSSYIYLVPFVIIIFYFVILIFRRLK